MGIHTKWDNAQHTAILVEFDSEWTWAELETAVAKTDDFIVSVENQVDVILDLEGTSIPRDFMNMAKSLLSNPTPRPNEGNRIVVGANKTIRTAYSMLQKAFSKQLNGREVLFANNLDDARAILRGIRFEQS